MAIGRCLKRHVWYSADGADFRVKTFKYKINWNQDTTFKHLKTNNLLEKGGIEKQNVLLLSQIERKSL